LPDEGTREVMLVPGDREFCGSLRAVDDVGVYAEGDGRVGVAQPGRDHVNRNGQTAARSKAAAEHVREVNRRGAARDGLGPGEARRSATTTS
jgi:hypothetical protein